MSLFFIVVLGFCCLILTLGSAHNLPPPYSKRSYHTNNSSISFSANNATNSTGAGKTPNSASSTSQTADFSITSQPVLLPAVHWNHDAGNIQNLVPQQDQKFYYSAGGNNDPTIEHVFAHLSSKLNHPCVVLDHSIHVRSIEYGSNALRIVFSTSEAYSHAKSTWTSIGTFLVATSATGVGDTDGQHTFLLINALEPKDHENAIAASVAQKVPIGEAMQEVEIVWGSYRPDNKSSPATKTPPESASSIPSSSTTSPPYNSPGNSSSASSGNGANSTCGQPPAPEIDGFPTTACGSPTFDKDLDDKIGYLEYNESDYSAALRDFAPGIDDSDLSSDEGVTRRRLHKRGWLSSAFKIMKNAYQEVKNDVVGVARKVGDFAVNTAQKIGQAVVDATAISPSINLDIPIDVKPSKLVDSPWGQALQIYRKENSSTDGVASGEITVFCVQCGIDGKVHLGGEARWTITEGVSKANVGMNGNLAAGVQIGIDAKAELKKEFPFPIAQVGIPGFSVSGLFTVGPVVELSAEVALGISLAGQVLAGIKMSIPNFSAYVDMIDGSKSSIQGFTPQFEKVFEAKAEISATAGIGLPLAIGIGIIIPPAKYSKTISLVEKPIVEANFKYAASTTCEGIGGSTDCINGISYKLNFVNDIYAMVLDKKYDLNQFKAPIGGDCFKIGPQSCSANESTTEASSTTGDQTSNTLSPSGGPTAISIDGGADDGSEGIATTSTNGPTATGTTGDGVTESNQSNVDTPTDVPTTDGANNGADSDTNANGKFRREDDPFDFVEDASDEPSDDFDFNSLSAAALSEASTADTDDASDTSQVDDIPDSSYVQINDLSGTYSLSANADNGNIYLAGPNQGSYFAASSGVIVADSSDNYLHYYPEVMAAYNVSRLRLSDVTALPKNADIIALVPVDYDSSSTTPSIYAAIDTKARAFVTITCDIEGEDSKLFLANDPDEAVIKLKEEKLRYTVTGGVVTQCYYLPWAASAIPA